MRSQPNPRSRLDRPAANAPAPNEKWVDSDGDPPCIGCGASQPMHHPRRISRRVIRRFRAAIVLPRDQAASGRTAPPRSPSSIAMGRSGSRPRRLLKEMPLPDFRTAMVRLVCC